MATETDSHATISSPENALSVAQNAGTRYQHLYKGLQRETNELQSLPTVELLGIDVDRRLSEATDLCSSYFSNSVRISELLENFIQETWRQLKTPFSPTGKRYSN